MTHLAFARGVVASPVLLSLLLLGTARAQELLPEDAPPEEIPSGPAEPGSEAPIEPEILSLPAEDGHSVLDRLFADLADPQNARWEQTQDEIWRQWSRSGSPSMDLLLRRADEAAGKGEMDEALRFLNDLVRLAPDFAEGWNKRATLHFMREDYGRSVADIERTLALEPRHFGALSGLGIILERTGRKESALRAWRRAAEIHPNLEAAQDAVERLAPEVDGRDL